MKKLVRQTFGITPGSVPLPAFLAIKKAFFLVLFICAFGHLLFSAENATNAPGNRVAIAVFPLQNLSGNTNIEHWQFLVDPLFTGDLAAVKSVHVLPKSSVEFAFRELKLKPRQMLQPAQARHLGETIEARKVVWGGYESEGDQWKLSVQMLDVATGKVSGKFVVSSTNWVEICSEMAEQLLHELGMPPTAEQELIIKRPFVNSMKALEWFSRGYADFEGGKTMVVCETSIRQAITLDPQFAVAHEILAVLLLHQGKSAAGLEEAELAIKTRPDRVDGHFVLGRAYLRVDDLNLARHELEEAVRIDPEYTESYVGLSDVAGSQEKMEEMVLQMQKAVALEPYNGAFHAQLGRGYTYTRESDKALGELKLAERYAYDDAVTEQMLGESYGRLNDIPKAIEHLQNFLVLAQARGISNSGVDGQKEMLAQLKARQTPHFLPIELPESFAHENLQAVLKEKLSAPESNLVINPLDSGPRLRKWAQQVTTNASTDLEKAKAIFDQLRRHIDLSSNDEGRRTALQTFHAWHNPDAVFTCQEYTFLYVAMARRVGLKAYYVMVEKDYRGRLVSHACAGVLIDGKALLVDPAYQWFGVAHEKFRFLTDAQVVGIYLCQLEDLARSKVAVKLIPDFSIAHVNLGLALAQAEDIKEAHREVEIGTRLDSNNWPALWAQGIIASHEADWAGAVKNLQLCVDYDPEFPKAHFYLAQALLAQKQYRKARDEFRSFLNEGGDAELQVEARRVITKINAMLQN